VPWMHTITFSVAYCVQRVTSTIGEVPVTLFMSSSGWTVEGAVNHNSVLIPSDGSLVANDHGDGSTGVDFYMAKYGSLFVKEGPVLVTIYLN
jgi:hypothetical protein